jgi:amino acid transporter
VLSFLGFDGIAMLVEEARGGSAQVGRAMRLALVLAGVLFIVQVWVAALLVPDPAGLLANGDPDGTAFYDAAAAAGGDWLARVTATATGLSWGLADTLVAQVAVSRLLFAMARDRQLPRFLATVSMRRSVPANATLFVAALSTVTVLGVWWFAPAGDAISLLSSLINMGALLAFLVLHVCVVVHYMGRRQSRNVWSHLVVPLAGLAILLEVVINANVLAQTVGLVWLGIGVVVLGGLYAAGRRPAISGLAPMGGER